ncbi:MAG: hypothetical protein LBT11_01990 [Treponema sp.]|jgi:hypothetical protein|nr:hypothetical protein [Treponema sp.]
MAIQPIDLQTLFTQIDKIGKEQSLQKEGVQIQAALQGMQIQKKTEERARSVNETQDTGQGSEGVKDRGPRGRGGGAPSKDNTEGSDKEGEEWEDPAVIWESYLGKNVDLSG